MILTEEKTGQLIIKLNRLTAAGAITWHVTDPPRELARGTDDFIPLFIESVYKSQRFGLYQVRYRSFDGERETFFWTERIVLSLLDDSSRSLWEVSEYSPLLVDLFDSVRRKVANVDGVLDDLLSDD
jgi:hypothetical protein